MHNKKYMQVSLHKISVTYHGNRVSDQTCLGEAIPVQINYLPKTVGHEISQSVKTRFKKELEQEIQELGLLDITKRDVGENHLLSLVIQATKLQKNKVSQAVGEAIAKSIEISELKNLIFQLKEELKGTKGVGEWEDHKGGAGGGDDQKGGLKKVMIRRGGLKEVMIIKEKHADVKIGPFLWRKPIISPIYC